jgi:hypothetical protein
VIESDIYDIYQTSGDMTTDTRTKEYMEIIVDDI